MRRSLRLLIVAALLCVAPLVRADALRLDAPKSGAQLRGGAVATLAWHAASLPPGSEEWEAFLSIDGGRYYAFRITPHLDLDRRSVDWIVPNVDASDARILIRTGDERHESLVALPASFRIIRDPHAGLVLSLSFVRGQAEAAREGDPDVVAWADGDRAGTNVALQSESTLPEPALRDARHAEVFETRCVTPPVVGRQRRAAVLALRNPELPALPAAPQPGRSIALLLACSRLNV